LNMYNAVETGKITSADKNFPACQQWPDYRMSQT